MLSGACVTILLCFFVSLLAYLQCGMQWVRVVCGGVCQCTGMPVLRICVAVQCHHGLSTLGRCSGAAAGQDLAFTRSPSYIWLACEHKRFLTLVGGRVATTCKTAP